MKIIGIDFGGKRTGVAISDEDESFAHPFDTIVSDSLEEVVEKIADYALEHDAGMIIVGLPLSMSGSDTQQTRASREFAAELEKRTGLTVKLQDERLSSAAAKNAMGTISREHEGRGRKQSSGKKRRAASGQDRSNIDRVAAVLILQSYLDKTRNDFGR